MEEKIKDKNIDNYFADVTYRIIPKKHKGYKLFTLSCIDNITNNSYICALILIKYEDTQSFIYVFKYLNNMFNFIPKKIHIDYSKSLRKALLSKEVFKNKPL